jgi:hypothetical protein
MARRTHKDVDYAVDDASGREVIFKTADEAAGFAVSVALSGRSPVYIDVLIYSRAGAKFYGGDDAVEQYDEDPEASVSERIRIKAESEGRVA